MITVNLITSDATTTIAAQGLDGLGISGAIVKQQLNEVSSATLRFPATNKVVQTLLGTNRPVIEVLDGAERVFYGGVVSAKVDIWGNTVFECDGALSFLADVVKAPFTCNNRTVADYTLHDIFDTYNNAVQTEHPERVVWWGGVRGFESVGNVNIDHSDEYTDTLTLLKEAVETYGGFMFETFSSSDAKPYVGWFKDPVVDGGRIIEFGKNEITLDDLLDFSDYASRVYGTGQNGLSDYVIDYDAEAAFGRRDYAMKTNAETAGELALQLNAECNKRSTPIRSIELTALDLEQLGLQYSGFFIGTTATLIDSKTGINTAMLINSIERDLLEPQNSKIVLGRAAASLTNSLTRG